MGRYKVNCDASFDMEGNMVGIGLVIRDSEGTVMASSSQSIENSRIQRYEPIEQILFKFPFIQSGVLYWLGFCGACYPMESETQRTKPVAAFMAFGTNGDVYPIAAIAAAFACDQKQYHVVLITHSAHEVSQTETLLLHSRRRPPPQVAVFFFRSPSPLQPGTKGIA
ncbi:hypothetical protein Q3G72_027671 [Acer saccharum]|nr:hypothetical protein Q3G72_027671 [Acer saccharum]